MLFVIHIVSVTRQKTNDQFANMSISSPSWILHISPSQTQPCKPTLLTKIYVPPSPTAN